VLVESVDGGGIDLLDLGLAEVGQDVAVDSAAVVGGGDRRDWPDLLAPAEPALDQLGDGPRGAPAVLATTCSSHLTCDSWCPWQDSNLQPAVPLRPFQLGLGRSGWAEIPASAV
jgi:hypothetical protein